MIRIAIMYPNIADKSFDFAYYRDRHMPLVIETYQDYGLIGLEIDEAYVKSGSQAGPYLAIGYMLFDSVKQFMQAHDAVGEVLIEDIANFTDIKPKVQISEFTRLL